MSNGFASNFMGRAIVVVGDGLEVTAYRVGDREPVEVGVIGEQPAVIGRYVQGSVAGVDRPEQPPEILPDRPWIAGIVVFVGFMNGFGEQESPVLAERAEQDAVQQLRRSSCSLSVSACGDQSNAAQRRRVAHMAEVSPGRSNRPCRCRPPSRSGRGRETEGHGPSSCVSGRDRPKGHLAAFAPLPHRAHATPGDWLARSPVLKVSEMILIC